MWFRKYIIPLAIFLAIIAGLIIWRTSWWQNILSSLSFYTSVPVYYGYQTGLDLKQTGVGDSEAANIEVVSQAELKRLRLENEQLRRELSLLPRQEFTTVGVEIIGKRQDETGISFLLNRGSTSNIKLGYPVLSGGTLVGVVVKVQPQVAEMILVNSPLFSTTVEILNNQTTRGLAEGEFNLATKIKLLPSNEEVKTGQLVITSGLDELIPRGIVLGSIAAVEYHEGDLFQEAVVVSPLDLNKLGILQVVIK